MAILSFSLLMVGVAPAKAGGLLNQQQKLEIITTPAYYVLGQVDDNKQESVAKYGCINKTEKELIALNDKEFMASIKKNLEWAINQKTAGANICWHP